MSNSAPIIIGHRGAPHAAPGNTLDSFEAAIREGADLVELDVRRTRDQVLVVHHRATRRRSPVSRLTYPELIRRCRHRPPTLEDVVALCRDRVGLDVEVKQRGCEAAVLEVLSTRFSGGRLLITSFDDEVIATVKRLAPGVRCGLLLGPARLRTRRRRFDELPFEWAQRCGADLIVAHQLLAPLRTGRRTPDAGFLSQAERRSVPVLVWTVNGPERIRRYLAGGRVAGVITDLPGLAAQIRRRLPGQRTAPVP